MWPEQQQTPHAESNLHNLLRQEFAADKDEDVRIQSELPTFGSAPQGPGIPIEAYADFSELLTKPETIAESPGAQDWDSNFQRLSNVRSVITINPSRRLQKEDNSSTSTSLARSSLVSPKQKSGSKKVKPHQEFFKEIIADSMQIPEADQSSNTNFERLRRTASSLAATALAPTTSDRYGRAWGRFKNFALIITLTLCQLGVLF